MSDHFRGGLTRRTVHLCVDMQRLFSDDGPWPTPWMVRVLPVVTEIASRFPERTIFTRFMTPQKPEDMPGMWRLYYEKWRNTTRAEIDPCLLDLMEPLVSVAPHATVIDKTRYSAFTHSPLLTHLQSRSADALIVSGSETDVCVLATVLDAVDYGYRVVIVRDAICSSSDAGHDALLKVYHARYSMQVETADAKDVLREWQ